MQAGRQVNSANMNKMQVFEIWEFHFCISPKYMFSRGPMSERYAVDFRQQYACMQKLCENKGIRNELMRYVEA